MQHLKAIAIGLLGTTALLVPVSAQSLTTTFAAGNNLNSPASNLFDITVLNTNGIVITSLDVNCENTRNGPVGSAFDVEVYLTKIGGTHAGNETTPGAWHLMSKGSGISKATATPTPVDIDDIFLPPGKFGIAIQYVIPTGGVGTAFSYTNGTGSNQSYSNADLKLDLGTASTGFFAGPVYSPRVWNGTVYYEAGKNAAFGTHGVGCANGAPTGVPTLSAGPTNPLPKVGGLFDLQISNLSTTPGVGYLIIGASSFTQWGGQSLPVDLGFMWLPGCQTYLPPDLLVTIVHTGPTFLQTIPIPNDPNLIGGAFGFQVLMRDVAAQGGATVSNMGGGRIGN